MDNQSIEKLRNVMTRLRDPQTGCPWDVKQDFKSIAPCTVEEAYEVLEAIENNDMPHLKEELGDLLLQVVFHSQMAAEKNLFTFDDVARSATDKMIDRHPHVFADRDGVNSSDDVLLNWEADKAAKRAQQADAQNKPVSALDGVNTALPSMLRALKLQQRAARVGFDWTDAADIIAKIHEEADELKVELDAGKARDNLDKIEDELGDVFFVLVNLARHLKLDPEAALRRTNQKFERRFRGIERKLLASGRTIEGASLDEMEALWAEMKKEEKVV